MDEDTYPVRKRNIEMPRPVRDEAPLLHRIEALEKRVTDLERGLTAVSDRDAHDLRRMAEIIGIDLPSQMPREGSSEGLR